MQSKPYKISTLVFIHDQEERLLLLRRNKAPNFGKWSPIGGKLDMAAGESPYECACRETREEVSHTVEDRDLHLFGYVAEKSYEGAGHWLMFLFDCLKPIETLPPDIHEGSFGLFSREEIDHLEIPDNDEALVWEAYDQHRKGFIGIRADCAEPTQLKKTIEIQLPEPKNGL